MVNPFAASVFDWSCLLLASRLKKSLDIQQGSIFLQHHPPCLQAFRVLEADPRVICPQDLYYSPPRLHQVRPVAYLNSESKGNVKCQYKIKKLWTLICCSTAL